MPSLARNTVLSLLALALNLTPTAALKVQMMMLSDPTENPRCKTVSVDQVRGKPRFPLPTLENNGMSMGEAIEEDCYGLSRKFVADTINKMREMEEGRFFKSEHADELVASIQRALDDPRIDINTVNVHGESILSVASELGITPGILRVINLLVDHVDMNINESARFTPLMHAVRTSDPHNVMRILGSTNVDVNFADQDGYTALHHAVLLGNARSHRNAAILNTLLARPELNVFALDRFGQTALSIAAWRGNDRAVRTLLHRMGYPSDANAVKKAMMNR